MTQRSDISQNHAHISPPPKQGRYDVSWNLHTDPVNGVRFLVLHYPSPGTSQRYEMLEEIPTPSENPTRVFCVRRDKDYSAERTDKRPSSAYFICGVAGGIAYVDFHEGVNPLQHAINGSFLLDLLRICEHRLKEHNTGPFKDEFNGAAIQGVNAAIAALEARAAKRRAEGTLGTQIVSPAPSTPPATNGER